MSAFIKVKTYHNGVVVDAFVNVDRILMVWDADYRDDMEGQCFYSMTDGFSTEHAAEPYDTVVAKILAATAKEKENIPPTPPIREKETLCANRAKRARVREGFKKPTVEEVAAHIAEKGYTFDAEEFWNFYESKGWRVGSHVMRSWTSACVTWQKIENRRAKRDAHFDAKMDERAERRTAHIDAKIDERERKRESRAGGGRKKADNYIASTPEQVKEFTDGL